MTDVALACKCGQVRGMILDVTPGHHMRVICYCDDCQAFARYLGRDADILDEYGGTEIFQVTPAQLEITQGTGQLRCMRLTPRGLFRWYTECCKTPIGNTVSAKLPYVGLIHNFMDNAGDRDEQLGPILFRVQGKYARGGIPDHHPVHPGFPLRSLVHIIPRVLLAKLRGQHKPSPFFDASGVPVVTPYIHTRPMSE